MRFNRLHETTNYIVPTDYTQIVSHFVAGLSYDDLPETVRLKAKHIIIQAIGAALASSSMDVSEWAEAVSMAGNNGEGGPCTSWGTGRKMSAVNAGFAAGIKTDLLSWGDSSDRGHFYSVIVPAAWAVAEEQEKSGRHLLTAVTAAYEICMRIADAVQPDEKHRRNGWGVTSWPIFGAAIAAAKLYDLDARQIDQVIGMACECSTIPTTYSYTSMSDFLHCEFGSRVRDGILIAKSVKKGINNARDTLDESSCYSCAMTDDWKPWLYTEELGKNYVILHTRLKRWPACYGAQAVLNAVNSILCKKGLTTDKIENIVIETNFGIQSDIPEEGFGSVLQASFCLPYMIAAMLSIPDPALWYRKENLKSKELLSMAHKVHVSAKQEVEAVYLDSVMKKQDKVRVMIEDREGEQYVEEHMVNTYSGSVGIDQDEAMSIFTTQAAGILSEEYAYRAAESLAQLETCDNIAELSWVLGAG